MPERIPPPRGRVLAIYGIIWWAALALAIAVTGLTAWGASQPQLYAWSYLGFSGSDSRDRMPAGTVMQVWSAEAQASGLRPGDAIVSIDGVPMERIGNDPATLRTSLRRPEGTMVSLSIRDRQARIGTHRLAWRTANVAFVEAWRRWTAAVALFSQMAFIVGAVALFGKRREPLPAILALALLLNASGYFGRDVWTALSLTGLGEAWGGLGSVLLLVGLAAFPDGRIGFPGKSIGAAAIALNSCAPLMGQDSIVFWGMYAVLIVAILGLQVYRYRHMAAGPVRQQVRWAFLGISGWIVCIVATIAFAFAPAGTLQQMRLALIGHGVTGMLAPACFVGGLLVSLLRYRLYDADVVIGRSATFGVLTIGFLALFAGSEKLIEIMGERYFGESLGALAGGMGAAFAAVLMVPMHRRVERWAEHRFQKALIRLRHGLPLLVGDLRETASAEAIADAVADAVVAGVQATHVAVVIDGEVAAARHTTAESARDWIAKHPNGDEGRACDAHFPLAIALEADAAGRVGWLLIGARPDGSLPGKDERAALREIADPVARAIMIVIARERQQQEAKAAYLRLESAYERLDGAYRELGARFAAIEDRLLGIGGRTPAVSA